MKIGDWVRRPKLDRAKWHLAESIVSDDAITKCGKRMAPISDGRRLETSEVMPLTRMIGQTQLCRRCYTE